MENGNLGLAEAQLVTEQEDRPHATPVSERKTRTNGLFWCSFLFIGTLVLSGVIVGSLCGSGLCSKQDDDVDSGMTQIQETFAPTKYYRDEDEVKEIEFRIRYSLGIDYFEESKGENSIPQVWDAKQKALRWILYDDPIQLDVSDSNHILQRYILVHLYFATTKNQPWLSCNPVHQEPAFCYLTHRKLERRGRTWLSEYHECQWAGVFCNGTEVTEIRIGE